MHRRRLHATETPADPQRHAVQLAIGLLLLLAATLASCAKDKPAPTAPSVHSVSGRVRLVGRLVTYIGIPNGVRIIDDADGIPVDLLFGTQLVQHTTTTGGVYQFHDVPDGGYWVRSRLDFVGDSTVITVASGDVTGRDTLELDSYGDISMSPNPFTNVVDFAFDISRMTPVLMQVNDLSGGALRVLLNGAPDSLSTNYLRWDGLDEGGTPVPTGNYWVSFQQGADSRAHLLFRDAPAAPGLAAALTARPPRLTLARWNTLREYNRQADAADQRRRASRSVATVPSAVNRAK